AAASAGRRAAGAAAAGEDRTALSAGPGRRTAVAVIVAHALGARHLGRVTVRRALARAAVEPGSAGGVRRARGAAETGVDRAARRLVVDRELGEAAARGEDEGAGGARSQGCEGRRAATERSRRVRHDVLRSKSRERRSSSKILAPGGIILRPRRSPPALRCGSLAREPGSAPTPTPAP